MRPEEVEARRAAEDTYGITARWLLGDSGMSDDQIDHLLGVGALTPQHQAVYRWTGVPATKEGDWLAACWAGGPNALLSHRPSLVLRGVRGINVVRPEITVIGTAKPRLAGVRVYRTDRLDPPDRSVVAGIPTTSALRTMLDVAWQLDDDTFEEVFEDACYRGLIHPKPMWRTLDRLGGHGRRGSARLRRYLERREEDERPPESKAELIAMRVFRELGLPKLTRQHWVKIADDWIRIDFAEPTHMVAVEINSLRHHGGTRQNLQRTSSRAAILAAAGWLVVPLTWWDLKDRPEWAGTQILGAIETRRGVLCRVDRPEAG